MAVSATPGELRSLVKSTAVLDWPAWGPTLPIAIEEFATATSIGWPAKRARAMSILANSRTGQLDGETAFGLLQDLTA